MALTHTARSGKTYYLHMTRTAKGQPKYFFSTKPDGTLADTIPDGYETYENVNSLVFLRRKTKQPVRDHELALVKEGLLKHAEDWRYKAEITKRIVVIHEACQDYTSLSGWADRTTLKHLTRSRTRYMPVMRFSLVEENTRMFLPQRYCFRGAVEDWIDIGEKDHLATLVRKYIKHLGKESLYDLF